jgi:hypothetical protein
MIRLCWRKRADYGPQNGKKAATVASSFCEQKEPKTFLNLVRWLEHFPFALAHGNALAVCFGEQLYPIK